MGNRFYYGMPSTQAFQAMNTLDDDVQAKSAAATTAAQAAASSASQAANARDAALAAWQASTAPNEQLAALSRQFHTGAIVDVFLYDTSRDSDGGAWRKRCKHTSWENETLVSGKWLGLQANLAAAQAAGGSNGDFYQSGVDNRFYIIGSGETFRGNTREFPALALIVVETARVVIYDATQLTLPMWMVFIDTGPNGVIGWSSGNVVGTKAVAAANGSLVIVGNSGGIVANFISDDMRCIYNAAYSLSSDRHIVSRNAVTGFATGGDGIVTVSYVNSDVSITVLPDAPMDAATGLPAPTIAFATQGGLSVIKHDGTSVSSSYNGPTDSPSFTVDRLYFQRAGAEWGFHSVPLSSLSAGFTGPYSIIDTSSPSVGKTAYPLAYGRSRVATRGNAGVCFTRENQASPGNSMVAYVSSTYNSGWQIGSSRGAWLADTVAETVSGANVIPNGDFSTSDTGMFTIVNWGTLSVVAGRLRMTKTGAQYFAEFYLPGSLFSTGKTYNLSIDFTGSTNNQQVGVYQQGNGYIVPTAPGARTIAASFVANGQAVGFVVNGVIDTSYADFDNLSIRLADSDRSVRGNAMTVNGTIAKLPVALGSQLVGYSGFSAANYLEQPYNSALDFGTGDFHIAAWLQLPAAPANAAMIIARIAANAGVMSGSGFQLYVDNDLKPTFCITTGGFVSGNNVLITSSSIALNTPVRLDAVRRSGVLELYINGVKDYNMSVSTENVTASTATTRIGGRQDNNIPFGGTLSLVRVSATAPSVDQIAQIYRDELPLFQPGAQCTIDGTSNPVTSIAYDDAADILHVGTSWGRSGFHGLQRIDSAAASTGAVTALSAAQGARVTGGSGGARYQQPAISLRDELRRKDVRAAAARDVTSFDFDSTAGMTDFTLPPGWSVRDVLVAGVRKRQGATKDYVVNFDGYRETARFAVSPGAAWVQVVANRSGAG